MRGRQYYRDQRERIINKRLKKYHNEIYPIYTYMNEDELKRYIGKFSKSTITGYDPYTECIESFQFSHRDLVHLLNIKEGLKEYNIHDSRANKNKHYPKTDNGYRGTVVPFYEYDSKDFKKTSKSTDYEEFFFEINKKD